MILVADGGSTKTNWCLIGEDDEIQYVDTEGYNPYFVTADYIADSVNKGFAGVKERDEITEVHFYGSGCFPGRAAIVATGISRVFSAARVFVELDLLAAARAVLGNTPGFTAILGTGTNTCVYDGKVITHNIDSLGYVLGDEGSGTALGKKLLAAYIREMLPSDIHNMFVNEYNLNKEDIFRQIYSAPLPNRFCAGFTTFIQKNIHLEYLRGLVLTCFREFFTNLVCQYEGYRRYTFNCIGSIGYLFSEQLKQVAIEFGMEPAIIIKSPIEGLINYHRKFQHA